jgi:transcriptional regulator with XRE-family HTH domain
MAEICELLAENLRFYRLAQNVSHENLAKITGVSVTAISKIENAKIWPKESTLKKLCDALKLHPFQLFVRRIDRTTESRGLLLSACREILDEAFPAEKNPDEKRLLLRRPLPDDE